MPSWQTHIFNAVTRATMKPLMRYGSIDMIRHLAPAMSNVNSGITPINDDIKAEAVEEDGYKGEWLQLTNSNTKKVILSFPGGGFILRMPATQRHYVARLCLDANTNALIVHYRLAPETPFPGGLEDCLAAYHDLLKKGHAAKDITLVGESAGGGLVLSTLLALRDEGTALPANAIVISPLADLTFSGKSRELNGSKDPMLSNIRHSGMHELYMREALPEDRFLSPIFCDFDDLPPIMGIVGSTEILLDDTVRAAEQAEKAGVPFHLEVWDQMPHVFPLIKALPESKEAIKRMARFINGQPPGKTTKNIRTRAINWE